jgi:D-3-phosphoglycerate dehydrogenase
MVELAFPKHKINVLLLEGIHSDAAAAFQAENYQIKTMVGSVCEEDLCKLVKDTHILGIRSKTQVTQRVLENAPRLWAIGAFCIGTNQIDLSACDAGGIAVFNAPFSNTRSVVELVLCEIIALMRSVVAKHLLLREGRWEKSYHACHEVRGKCLGIIGYGSIGSQLSVLAEAIGMRVCYYDLSEKLALGNAQRCRSMEALLKQADVVSVHVDGSEDNRGLITERELSMMKQGAYFLNLSRGFVVDTEALYDAVAQGHIAGVGLDVYPEEPRCNGCGFESKLATLPNVILTPHIGGSTEEAQQNIARFVPSSIIQYMNYGATDSSVNFPRIKLLVFDNSHRISYVHRNEPGVLAAMNHIFAEYKINVVSQYLKTTESLGYVIADIDKGYQPQLLDKLKAMSATIRVRILY